MASSVLMGTSTASKSFLRSRAGRSSTSTRPYAARSLGWAGGTATPQSSVWLKPSIWSMLRAATLPAAMALIADAGPVWQSPPTNTFAPADASAPRAASASWHAAATGHAAVGAALLVALARAFSSGSVAVTGVEAIGTAVPTFRSPRGHNASRALVLVALMSMTAFIGITWLADVTDVQVAPDGATDAPPEAHHTLLVQLADAVFGNTPAVARTSYVDPRIVHRFETGKPLPDPAGDDGFAGDPTELTVWEAPLLALLGA